MDGLVPTDGHVSERNTMIPPDMQPPAPPQIYSELDLYLMSQDTSTRQIEWRYSCEGLEWQRECSEEWAGLSDEAVLNIAIAITEEFRKILSTFKGHSLSTRQSWYAIRATEHLGWLHGKLTPAACGAARLGQLRIEEGIVTQVIGPFPRMRDVLVMQRANGTWVAA